MMASAKTTSIDKALKDIDEQKYDMVAVGRALLSDHEWVIKMKEGRLKDINPYTKESLLEMY
jgi:2,4-dienoyl-CoA reductase-like NADH-dependent reductase (Old Yellow Enzyme family)